MTLKLAKRLVEPDFHSGPKWIYTLGPEVAHIAAGAGLEPDPQQELCLNIIFGRTKDGLPSCFSFGCVVCRQNLKTATLKMAGLGFLFVDDVPYFVWSAHDMTTTRETQSELHALFTDSPSLSKYLPAQKNEGLYTDNGEERIELTTGQEIKFKARTLSKGRGLSAPKVILDEAFALKPAHVGSLLPTMMARPAGQVLYASSAGMVGSDVLKDIRDRGRAGTSPRLAYVEWCAPKVDCEDQKCEHPKSGAVGCALDDEDLYRKANPTLTTGRITLQTIRDLRQELPPEEFMRECLGWWDEDGGDGIGAFPRGWWSSCEVEDGDEPDPGAIGVSVSMDQEWASIAAAGVWEDGRVHLGGPLEGARQRGTQWLGVRLLAAQEETGCAIVIDGGGPAAYLIEPFRELGIDVLVAKSREYFDACASLYDAVRDEEITHMDHPDLTEAVKGAIRRDVGDAGRWAWGRKKSVADVSMLEAATLAYWAVGEGVAVGDTYL